MGKYREFAVVPGVVGFKVVMGCKELYFGDVTALKDAIDKYLDDPDATQEEFLAKDQRSGIAMPEARINQAQTRLVEPTAYRDETAKMAKC